MTQAATAHDPSRAALIRLFVATMTLGAEYLALSLVYDAQPLRHQPGIAAWFGFIGTVAPLAVVVAAVSVAFLGARLLTRWRETIDFSPPRSVQHAWWALHVVAVGALFVLTHRLLGHALLPPQAGIWIAGWFVAGMLSATSLALWVLPPPTLLVMMRQVSPLIAVAVALATVVWGAGTVSVHLWDPLGRITLIGVAIILQFLVPNLVYDPVTAEVGDARFYVRIDPVCSGYEGIGLIVVFLAVYLWTARRSLRFPQAWWLVPIAVGAVFVGNILRITALIQVGLWVSPRVAVEGFHSKAGWVFFCAIALGIVAWSRRSPWFSREPTQTRAMHNPVAPWVVPLLAVITAALVTGLFVSEVDRAYAVRVAAGGFALWMYRGRTGVPDWRPSLEAAAFGVVVFALWLLLNPEPVESRPSAALDGLSAAERLFWIGTKMIGSILLIPVVEERAFRGYLLRRLSQSEFESVSWTQYAVVPIVVSSLAFGALHQAWIAGTVAGVLFAVVQGRRGNFGEAVFAHAVSNTLVAVWALGFGRMDLWL